MLAEAGGDYGDYQNCVLIGDSNGFPITPYFCPATNNEKLKDNGRVANFNIRRNQTVAVGMGDREALRIVVYKVTDIKIFTGDIAGEKENIRESFTSEIHISPEIIVDHVKNEKTMKLELCNEHTKINEKTPIIKAAELKMSTGQNREAIFINFMNRTGTKTNTAELTEILNSYLNDENNIGIKVDSYDELQKIVRSKASEIRRNEGQEHYRYTKMKIASFFRVDFSEVKEEEDATTSFEKNLDQEKIKVEQIIFYNGEIKFHGYATIDPQDFIDPFFKKNVAECDNYKKLLEKYFALENESEVTWFDFTGN
jgi:hypothetical protein